MCNLQFSAFQLDKRTKQQNLTAYPILNQDGDPIGLPEIDEVVIKEILAEVFMINFFHEDGDVLGNIEDYANQFAEVLANDSDWVDCEVSPMKNDKGFCLKREPSKAIRGTESILGLLDKFKAVVVPDGS